MNRFLQNIQNSPYSFWIGFVAGSLFWWLVSIARRLYPRVQTSLKTRISAARQGLATSTEERFRKDILRLAQGLHLASPLFSLDEIVETPFIISPPAGYQPVETASQTEIETEDTRFELPYLPDWPELAAAYHAPVMTLQKALSGGANLILIGQPGSGKTVSLAYLASRIAQQSAEVVEFSGYVPILVHAANLPLSLQTATQDTLNILIEAISWQVSGLTLPRLPGMFRSAFENGNALLLLDGLDELNHDQVDQVVDHLSLIISKYPKARMVVAASPDYYDGLTALGLAPVAMATWNVQQKTSFLKRWGEMWDRAIYRGTKEEIDPILINNWILSSEISGTPLELTLKAWAAYAGDTSGATAVDSIQAYVKRMTANIQKADISIQQLALHVILNISPAFNIKDVERPALQSLAQQETISEAENPPSDEIQPVEKPLVRVTQVEPASISDQQEAEEDLQTVGTSITTSKATGAISSAGALRPFVDNGLLIIRKDNRLSFFHPVITGYVAGSKLSKPEELECLQRQPDWSGKDLTMRFMVVFSDLTQLIAPMVEPSDDPLQRKLLKAACWLRDAQKTSKWRGLALRYLAGLLQEQTNCMGLRARALIALVLSGDPGVNTLCRQLLVHRQDIVRELGCLGCGILRDPKAVSDLLSTLNDTTLEVSQAALMALFAIGNKTAKEAVVGMLLEGGEEMRRTAAELLASDPEEGQPTLKEGAALDDLLVRRAVVYGIARINETWALQMLEKMQIEDGQWVVRSAATQALEEIRRPDPHIPHPLLGLTESPWLIAYAGKLGMGVSPGKPANNMLYECLKNGEPEQRMAGLDYLIRKGDAGAAPAIYNILFGAEGELREAAFNTLWHIAATGADLPSPMQFGMG